MLLFSLEIVLSTEEVVYQIVAVLVLNVATPLPCIAVHRLAHHLSNRSPLQMSHEGKVHIIRFGKMSVMSFSVGAGGELESSKRRIFSIDSERLQAPKPQPGAPPPVSEENELMAKLKRRQNKIIEAEQTAPEPVAEEAREEEEPVQPKPPPPPQRKTPTLNSVPQQSASQEQAAPQEAVLAKQKKAKPPPPKPKDAEEEMSPWQQELAARRARMADHERESDLEQGGNKDDQSQEKPDPIPKPAPKPKRNKAPPSGAKPVVPSPAQEQSVSLQPLTPDLVPFPVVPSTVEPPEDTLPSAVPPVIPVKREPVTVVVEEPEHPAMPSEVSTLVADQRKPFTTSFPCMLLNMFFCVCSVPQHKYELLDYSHWLG